MGLCKWRKTERTWEGLGRWREGSPLRRSLTPLLPSPPNHADVCVSAARCGVGCDDGGLSCHDRYVCV